MCLILVCSCAAGDQETFQEYGEPFTCGDEIGVFVDLAANPGPDARRCRQSWDTTLSEAGLRGLWIGETNDLPLSTRALGLQFTPESAVWICCNAEIELGLAFMAASPGLYPQRWGRLWGGNTCSSCGVRKDVAFSLEPRSKSLVLNQ